MSIDTSSFDPPDYCFKITLFNIDSYITKPHLIYDDTYSTYRKSNINLATVIRIFGSTDNGIKTCLHVHQHCPHFSVRQIDLARAYGIELDDQSPELNEEVISKFIKEVEDELIKNIDSRVANKNEIFIVDVQKYSAFSFYGYHNKQDVFYKILFNTYWMANQAKNLLESGFINQHRFICYNFLELLLQFYVDHEVYLNTLYFKKITFRNKSPQSDELEAKKLELNQDCFDFIQKQKLDSIANILQNNDLKATSSCSLECDALVTDLILVERKRIFPENKIFSPTIPGIVQLWNEQYERSPEDFENLVKTLQYPKNSAPDNDFYCRLMRTKKKFILHETIKIFRVPQLDGPCDSSDSVGSSCDQQETEKSKKRCIFQNKEIELDLKKFTNGVVCAEKFDCFAESTNTISIIANDSHITIQNVKKKELIASIEKKIKLFHRSSVNLFSLQQNLKNFGLKNATKDKQDVRKQYEKGKQNNQLKLHFSFSKDCNKNFSLQSTPKRLHKFKIIFNKSHLFQKNILLKLLKDKNQSLSKIQGKFLNLPHGFSSSSQQSNSSKKHPEPFDRLDRNFEWSQCLNMTVMSLELHARIRGNLLPDPNYDPIQMVMFAVYDEVLKDELNPQLKKSKIQYFGAIVVKNGSYSKHFENIILNNKNVVIEYVSSECDLVFKMSYYVQNFDPDIISGYIVDTASWGYLLQRAIVLGIEIGPQFSRITDLYLSKKSSPGSIDHAPQLIGRIVFNTWRLLRKELSLRSYTFEEVYQHLFEKRFPKYPNNLLNEFWERFILKRNDICKLIIIEYYFHRVIGSLKILTHLDFIRRTFDLSCLFGMPFQDVNNRGTQFRVESMLFPLCHKENFIPIRFQNDFITKQQSAQCTPLIFEPEIAYHPEPVAVMDFQSLYPSIIIGSNYCFSTCLGRVNCMVRDDDSFGCYGLDKKQIIVLNESDIDISPNEVVFVRSSVRRGILPKMLEEILNTRIMVKKELKNINKKLREENLPVKIRRKLKSLQRRLDVSQLGLKMIANVTYGYTSANFSGRMPCVEIADSIVSKGRETLETTIGFVNKWGSESGTNVHCIYGDTDSLFISFPSNSIENSFDIANFILKEINKRQPYPICLKLEKIYQNCIILSKKRYCGFMMESAEQRRPTFDAKGIETIRRDTCNMTAKILEKSIKILFESGGDIESLKPYLQFQWKKIFMNRLNSLADFIFAREFSGFNNYSNETIIPACIIGRKRMLVDPRRVPKFKERIPYVIVDSRQGRVADMVREPMELLMDGSLRLNASYYIRNVFIPPLLRLIESINDDGFTLLNSWYEQVRQQSLNLIQTSSIRQDHLERLNLNQNFSLFKINANDSHKIISSPFSKPAILILDSIWKIGKKLKKFEKICSECAGTDIRLIIGNGESSHHHHQCMVDTCPILSYYQQARRDFNYLLFLDRALSIQHAHSDL